jgi:hypothetical protein
MARATADPMPQKDYSKNGFTSTKHTTNVNTTHFPFQIFKNYKKYIGHFLQWLGYSVFDASEATKLYGMHQASLVTL